MSSAAIQRSHRVMKSRLINRGSRHGYVCAVHSPLDGCIVGVPDRRTVVLALDAIAADADAECRLSLSTQSTRADRDNGVPGVTTADVFDVLQQGGDREEAGSESAHSKAEARQSPGCERGFLVLRR